MRTPTDERTGFRLAAWAGALLLTTLVLLFACLYAGATVVEVTSESVSASYQLADAAPVLLAVPLLTTAALGGLLARWAAGWAEIAAVVPVLVVLPYLVLAGYVAWLWSPTGLPLTGDDDPGWTRLLATASAHLLLVGIGALLLGLLAGRLGTGPYALVLLVALPALALTLLPPAYGRIGFPSWDTPVWFDLRVLADGEAELSTYGVCGPLSVGICEGTVGPLTAGVHLLALLAVLAALAVAASAATRRLRRPRRRLSR